MTEPAKAGLKEPLPDRVRLDIERRTFINLLRMTNTQTTPKEIAQQVVILAQQMSRCEAVAVRLKDGPDFPYVASLGFPNQFLALENSLCLLDEQGHLQRDGARQPKLACICGRVLLGQVEPDIPCFTDRGSFYTPSTSQHGLTDAQLERLGETRGRCHTAGYETIALFPIRRERVTYGLIHCNDSRPERIAREDMDLLEALADAAAHLFQQVMA